MLNISYLHFISLAFVFIYMSCFTNSATLLQIKLFKYLSNKKFSDKPSGRAERPRILPCRRLLLF